jgi:hypothetical protein
MLRLRELRALIRTPELLRPRVYICRGCGLGFRAAEAHDFVGCAAKHAVNRCNLDNRGNAASGPDSCR